MNALGFPTRLAKLLVEACEKAGVQVGPSTKFSPVVEPFGTSASFYIVKLYRIEL